jgi:hypothetical protein
MKIPPELGLPRNAVVLGDIQQLVRLINEENAKKPRKEEAGTAPLLDKANEILLKQAKHLATVATTAWKMQKRVLDPESQEARGSLSDSDARKLARDVQSLLTTLSEMGLTIRDRTGEPFDYGMPEKVVDAKAQPGITKERVAETLRPTITWSSDFWKDTMIQKGEVVIHTPEA